MDRVGEVLVGQLRSTVAGDDIAIGSVADRCLLSGIKQTSHFKGVRTVFDPNWPHSGGRLTASGCANLSVLREGASGGGTSLARRNTHRVRL